MRIGIAWLPVAVLACSSTPKEVPFPSPTSQVWAPADGDSVAVMLPSPRDFASSNSVRDRYDSATDSTTMSVEVQSQQFSVRRNRPRVIFSFRFAGQERQDVPGTVVLEVKTTQPHAFQGNAGNFTAGDTVIDLPTPAFRSVTNVQGTDNFLTFQIPIADKALCASRTVAIAYETVELPDHELPLLTPMSEVAGRMAVQEGAKYLERHSGGRGVLLGGVPGVLPGKVVILGGGVVGMNAAMMAAGLGATVAILDVSLQRLRYLEGIMPANVNLLFSTRYAIRKQIRDADLVIGAVLLHGARAPSLIVEDDLKTMRPGSVIVDVAVDQGGCVDTIRPTTHTDPIYTVHDVIHYGVANMPGGVPRTSTLALTNATLPYALILADLGWRGACQRDPALALGVNLVDGHVTYPGVAEAFGLDHTEVQGVLALPAQA